MKNMKCTSAAVVFASTFTVLATSLLSAPANALTLQTSGSFDFAAPNVNDGVIPIQKFDSSLGTLNSVLIEFTGTMQGNAAFENGNINRRTATVIISGLFDLTLPTGNTLSISPAIGHSYDLPRYDGSIDFAGASGRTVEITATAFDRQIYTSNTVLNALTGSGVANFLFSAIDDSAFIGLGRFNYRINTLVRGDASVTYDYTPASTPIPTPALLPGLIGIGVAAIRKSKAEQKETVEV